MFYIRLYIPVTWPPSGYSLPLWAMRGRKAQDSWCFCSPWWSPSATIAPRQRAHMLRLTESSDRTQLRMSGAVNSQLNTHSPPLNTNNGWDGWEGKMEITAFMNYSVLRCSNSNIQSTIPKQRIRLYGPHTVFRLGESEYIAGDTLKTQLLSKSDRAAN